jgi:hypothetical protein
MTNQCLWLLNTSAALCNATMCGASLDGSSSSSSNGLLLDALHV